MMNDWKIILFFLLCLTFLRGLWEMAAQLVKLLKTVQILFFPNFNIYEFVSPEERPVG